MSEKRAVERRIPGTKRGPWFGEAEHAEHAGAVLKRIGGYFAREKAMTLAMLAVVVAGTLCGVLAPSLQSQAIDVIAGEAGMSLLTAVIWMLLAYLAYSLCQLFQGLISAKLSQRKRENHGGKPADAFL